MEDAGADVGGRLRGHDEHHEDGNPAERQRGCKAQVERQRGGLDEAETGVVEHGGRPDSLWVALVVIFLGGEGDFGGAYSSV